MIDRAAVVYVSTDTCTSAAGMINELRGKIMNNKRIDTAYPSDKQVIVYTLLFVIPM